MQHIVLTLSRYPNKHILTAIHSMPFFRIPLFLNKQIAFFKLMGCGKNGVFSLQSDWNQWALLTYSADTGNFQDYEKWKQKYYGKFISNWWKFCGCETWTIILEPVLSHGTWNKISLKTSPLPLSIDEPVAVLTRATIKTHKAYDFWKNVVPIQKQITNIPGLTFSIGMGEMPLFRQATFSIWENQEMMKAFAYSKTRHKDVVKQTRENKWYSEEMFTRFRIVRTAGSIFGTNPFPKER